MAYRKTRFQPGDWAVTRWQLKAEAHCFAKGTRVKVTSIGPHGYNLMDEAGHDLIDCGFHSLMSDAEKDKKTVRFLNACAGTAMRLAPAAIVVLGTCLAMYMAYSFVQAHVM